MAVKLTNYDIIKGPVVSDKAHALNRTKQQLVLRVHPKANKPQIKSAIEQIFKVGVQGVRTLIRKKSASRVMEKRYDATPTIKREKIAYVTLAEGQSLNLFDQAGVAPVEGAKSTKTER